VWPLALQKPFIFKPPSSRKLLTLGIIDIRVGANRFVACCVDMEIAVQQRLNGRMAIARKEGTGVSKLVSSCVATALMLSAAPAIAQYYDPYGRPPLPELREYIDNAGNRVFLNQYGEVVSIVPPVDQAPVTGSIPQDYNGGGYYNGGQPVLEGRVDPYRDPYGYDDRAYQPFPQQDPGQYYPPQPNYGSVDRQPIQPSNPGYDNSGPQPYTPPAGTSGPATATPAPSRAGSPEVAALQVYLDRRGFSPGVIDGQIGSNVRKALAAYEQATGERIDPNDVDGIMNRLVDTGGLPIKQYTITNEDVAGPFIASVPTDYSEKALLENMSFTSPAEMLAERFHMDEGYLRAINPNADFSRPGTVIKVMDTGSNVKAKVTRIVADKSLKQVFAYDESGTLVAAYPATIGSQGTPSPSGTHTVERIALDPNYTYNPRINFKQGNNDRVLTIPPGPNGPVGTVWIALSKPTYGIHGTPEPSAIGKTESNGCIRLTNWDARELAGMVERGVVVEFVDDQPMLLSETETETQPITGQAPAAAAQPSITAPQPLQPSIQQGALPSIQ
jgi:lipoprotein-anchoring transpeptidase ErfK/SrfK